MNANQLADLRQRVEKAALLGDAVSYSLSILDVLDLLDTLEDMKDENSALETQLGDLQDELDDFERRDVDNDELREENARLKTEIDGLEQQLFAYKNDNADLREGIANFISKVERGGESLQ